MERRRERLRGHKSGGKQPNRSQGVSSQAGQGRASLAREGEDQTPLMILLMQAAAALFLRSACPPSLCSPAAGPSQDTSVLHQLLLVIPSAPDGAESALLLPACHTDQADHRGPQEEDQGRHEQPHQDHRFYSRGQDRICLFARAALHARLLGEVAVLVAPAPAVDEAVTGILLNVIVPSREGCAARPSDSLWDTVFFIVEDLTREVLRILLPGNTQDRRLSSISVPGHTINGVPFGNHTIILVEPDVGGARL